MEYIFNIDLTDDKIDTDAQKLSIFFPGDTCHLFIGDKEISLSQLLANEENYTFIKQELKELIVFNQKEDREYALECQKFLDILNHQSHQEFYSHFSTIRVGGSLQDIIDYVTKNPWLKKLKIINNKFYEFSDKGLDEATKDIEMLKSATNCDIWLTLEGNEEAITLEDFKKVLSIIDTLVSEIKKLNLSPFETVLYVYDLIRNREYKAEDENEAYTKSRDLASVLLGDKIVCAGFVNVFNTILHKLGIPCSSFRLLSTEQEDNHVESVVYLKDAKYDLDGLYLFDPTFECKDADNSYLTHYYFFAKTLDEMQSTYAAEKLLPNCKYVSKKGIQYLESLLPREITPMEMGKYKLLKGINSLLILIGKEPLKFLNCYDKEEFMSIYQNLYNYINQVIPPATFAKAFFYVRSIEYYLDPSKYPFDKETIERATYTNSLPKMGITPEAAYLLKILNVKPSTVKRKKVNEIVTKEIDTKRIEEIKLTRVLRNKVLQNS